MKLYKTTQGIVIEDDTGALHLASPSTAPPPPACPPVDWDTWTNRDDLHSFLTSTAKLLPTITATEFSGMSLLAPIGSQEVWCAGVTYKNSQVERMKESDTPDFCTFFFFFRHPRHRAADHSRDCARTDERVYSAPRPEIFFKAMAQRVSGPDEPIHIRRDSTWDVPEPELAIFMTSSSKCVFCTMPPSARPP